MEKKSLRLPALIALAIYTLYGCVLAPLYQYLISDIVLSDTLWLDLIDLLYQYAEILGSATLIGFCCYAVYRYGVAKARPMLLLSLIALIFKYVATVVAVSIVYGSIDLTGELFTYLFAFLLECGILALTVLLSHRLITPTVACYKAQAEAARVLEQQPPEDDGCYPFKKLLDFKNPLQRTLFFGLLIVVGWRLIAAVMNEFAFGVMFRDIVDVLITLLYWVILILLPGCLGYLLSLLCVRIGMKKNI